MKSLIKQHLNVKECDIAPLAIQQNHDSTLRMRTIIDGIPSTLRLTATTARASNYQVLVQQADGSLLPAPPSPERAFRGVVDEQPGVIVGGSWLDDGFHGLAIMPDGSKHWIQPAASITPGVDPVQNLHVSFKGADILPCDRHCGVKDHHGQTHPIAPHQPLPLVGGVGINTSSETLCVAQIAIDADHEFFLAYGSVAATEARLNAIMNAVNTQYASEAGITHQISTIIVRESPADPYTSSDADTLLTQFGEHWDANHTGVTRDIAHLFTGKNMNGGTIGLAWLAVICEDDTYGYGLTEGTFSPSFACVTDVCAHELGHNWSCDHCACPSHTMNPSSTCANQFTAGSVSEIINHRNSVGCLDCGSPYNYAFQVSGDSVGDRLGDSVALGDVNGDDTPDIVVGASFDDQNGMNAGKVWVFNGDDGSLLWSKLGQAAGDRFGHSVAVSNGRVIVGAPYNDAKATNAGRAHVFNGLTGAPIKTYNGASTGDLYGFSVSGGKDVNNDGTEDILIGAPLNNIAGTDAGAVYLYHGATFGLLKRLVGERVGDRFGWSVAMLGKVNVDSHADFIVGAPYNDDQAINAGEIYVYSGINYLLLTTKRGEAAGDQFGRAVASAGFVNTDNRVDYAVGAPYADPGSRISAGRAYVYTGLTHFQVWTKNGVTAGDRLGSSISTAGDATADGKDDVLIGAPYQDGGGSNSGRTYACSGVDGSTLFTFTGQTAGDTAGVAVAGWSGDGQDRIAVTAPLRNDPSSDAGMAFVFNVLADNNDSNSDSPGTGASVSSVLCAADVAGQDRQVNGDDLLSVLNHWAQCASPCSSGCAGDVTRNCAVDHEDLVAIINAWGDCP